MSKSNRVLSVLVSLVVLSGCDNVESSIKELAETSQQSNNDDGGEREADIEAYSEDGDSTDAEQQENVDVSVSRNDLPIRHMEQYYGNSSTVKRRYSLVDNKLHGAVYDYYTDGVVQLKSEYDQGVKVGKWTLYDGQGDISQVQEYHQDILRKEVNYKGGEVENSIELDKYGNITSYYTSGNIPFIGSSENGLLSGEAEYTIEGYDGVRREGYFLGIYKVTDLSKEAKDRIYDLVEKFQQSNPDIPRVRSVRFKYRDAVARNNKLVVGASNVENIIYLSDHHEVLGSQE